VALRSQSHVFKCVLARTVFAS